MKNVSWSLLLILFACSNEQRTQLKYYDFDRLLNEQIWELSQQKVALSKTANLDGNASDTTFIPSAEGWEAEMDVFRELEAMNRPAYRNIYKVVDSLKDSRSNLTIRKYAGTPSMPVIEFYYYKDFNHLRKLVASISDKNILHDTSRVLQMEFEEGDSGHPLLTRYTMEGYQKMILKDTIHFSMEGQIDW